MPFYQIRCTACGKEEEVRCHHKDIVEMVCNDCGNKVVTVPTWANFKVEGFRSRKGVLTKNYE